MSCRCDHMNGRYACVGGNTITVMCCFVSVGTSNYKKKLACVCQNGVNGTVIFLLSQSMFLCMNCFLGLL